MFRQLSFLLLLFIAFQASSQRLLDPAEAVDAALNNQRNLKAARLSVEQQQQLLRGSAGLDNPQVFGEATPYEPLIVGIQQSFSLPGVYRNRRILQEERIRLARLQLQGNQYELKRDVRFSYLELQYFQERYIVLQYQDSIYQAIKNASKRFFDAGQINKLEELQATSAADAVRNELLRALADFSGSQQLLRFYTGINDSLVVSRLQTDVFLLTSDTAITNIQQEILRQQVAINEKALNVERAELLPQLQAGVSFPTKNDYERLVGYQFGISIPIWGRQNRSRINAAKTGIEIARAEQELEQLRLNTQYRQALNNYQRDWQSLNYFNSTALPQARAIIETSQRLFQGGELNYIESLRNLQAAFDIFFNHIETHRNFNEAVIQLNFLNGRL